MAEDDAPPGKRVESSEAAPSRTDAMPIPTSILNGKYRVERGIGQGAFGRVYLAFDPLLRRNVAIKELLATRGATDSAIYERYLERFHREARAAGGLEHPNIVTVYELAIAEDEAYYLVMQYVDGTDIRELLRSVGSLPVERSVAIATDVARALEATHDQDIVHRDVKPANIMLTSRGAAKLTDFGIAQVGHESHRTQMTIGHPGTPIYMSPEQATSAEYLDGRSDLYSLGLVIYEMLTGEPFARKKQPLGTVRGDLPLQLIRIVDRLLERDPNARYQSAAELLRDLGTLPLMSGDSLTNTDSPPSRSSDEQETVLPSATGRTPTSDPIEGVPGAYGGTLSHVPPGAPLPAPALPDLNPDHPARPVTTRRRSLLIGIGGLLALVIVVGALGALLLSSRETKRTPTETGALGAARPTLVPFTPNPALPKIPPATGGFTADLGKWQTDDTTTIRRTYDRTTGEYHYAYVTGGLNGFIFAPDIQTSTDFILEADVRRVSGSETGEYGLIFRVQPKGPGDTTEEHYALRVNAHGEYLLIYVGANNAITTIQPLTASTAIKTGDATNHLTVLCKGSMITVAINGTTVGTWKATLVKPGRIGVAVVTTTSASGIDAAFKDVRLSPAP